MRRHWKVAFAVASFAFTGAATLPAQAAPMDPAPDRLYLQPGNMPAGQSCQNVATNPSIVLSAPFPSGAKPGDYACVPNNVSWANLMSELGYAIAPSAFHPARTTGFGGFTLSLEASFAHINSGAQDSTGTYYWQAGTQGDKNPNNGAFSGVNKYPDSILQIYTLKARKGLPFGFEITGALGYVANTSLWLGGADVHWALLEGFRTGILGYLPDIAIGGGVRTVGGASSFFLTTVGIGFSVYFGYVELFEINALCPVCLTAYIFGVITWVGSIALVRKVRAKARAREEKPPPETASPEESGSTPVSQ